MRIGDVVRLKSGSPTMTVEKIAKNHVDVIWHYKSIMRERIPAALLEIVDVEKEIDQAEQMVKNAFQQASLGQMNFRGPGN